MKASVHEAGTTAGAIKPRHRQDFLILRTRPHERPKRRRTSAPNIAVIVFFDARWRDAPQSVDNG